MATRAYDTQRVIVLRLALRESCGGSYGIAAEYTVASAEVVPYNRWPIDAPAGASPRVMEALNPVGQRQEGEYGRTARAFERGKVPRGDRTCSRAAAIALPRAGARR
jgi:hypothetical protein